MVETGRAGRRLFGLPIFVIAVVVGVGLTSCAGGGPSRSIAVTDNQCANGWKAPGSGTSTFYVTNRTTNTVDVQLRQAEGVLVYGEIFTLGPGVTRPLSVTLAPGRYAWQCASLSGAIYDSDSSQVTGGPVASNPSYFPIDPDDLDAAGYTYRDSVTAGLRTLAAATDGLRTLVDAGSLAQARNQWLVAHLDYERLGAAYDTFGPFDDEIDGRPDGLPLGVNDPGWTGFRRLEYGLWHDQSPATLTGVADQLDANVHGLVAAFPHQLLINTDLPLRTHEILENALQFEMTGDTDEGSHTNLATVRANVDGTVTTLDAIAPYLKVRNPALLASVQAGLANLATALDAYRGLDGTWTPVQSLTQPEREQLDGTISALLEQLSMIPGTLRLFAVGAD
jgi:iron uptake system EfeUOB component EfeO/EfeM